MSEARQLFMEVSLAAQKQSFSEVEALNTFRGPQGPRGEPGGIDNLVINGKEAVPVDGKNTINLTAADVYALPSGGTAVNANALNGKGAEFYATAEIVSDEFDTEKNYNPGDYCISDNKLWRCRIASQGVVPSDDSSEWIQCNIAGEIQNYIVLNTYEFPNSSVVGGDSNMFDVTMNGYTPIAISYAMTNFVGCDIVGTRLYGNNADLRFSQSQSGIIVRFGVLYKKS